MYPKNLQTIWEFVKAFDRNWEKEPQNGHHVENGREIEKKPDI